PRGL
ncbi:hypothetical protein D030_2844B, partial [Vibrio parahaemolyticus AQ3810]